MTPTYISIRRRQFHMRIDGEIDRREGDITEETGFRAFVQTEEAQFTHHREHIHLQSGSASQCVYMCYRIRILTVLAMSVLTLNAGF